MSEDRPQHEMDDQELDSLLAEARWPAPSRESQHRLASFCLSLNRRQWRTSWAIAAAVLVAVSVGISVYLSQLIPTAAHLVRHDPPSPTLPTMASSRTAGDLIVSRLPSRLELAMLMAAEKEAARKASEKTDRSSMPRPQDLRAELVAKIRSGNPSERQTAAKAYASAATAEDIPMLLEMDRVPELRDSAVDGLAQLAQPALLVSLVHGHVDALHKRKLISALLRHPIGEVVRDYLDLVGDPSTQKAALNALHDVPGTPSDVFFAALNDPHVSTRNAAARVLGRIDGRQTTDRLIAMVAENQSRREALLALAESHGPEARRFVEAARIGGPLAGAVRSILLEQSTNE